ncbi:MAG: carbamate kinase [Myxococcota bacterium]
MSDPVGRCVIALGGNALLPADQHGEPSELIESANRVSGQIVGLLRAGYQVLVVHGNGPQVGIELIRSEEASTKVPPFGLDLCVANTQGSIATLLEVALRNALVEERMPDHEVVAVTTLVSVDRDDPAFSCPTKPIGPFYSGYRRRQIMAGLQAKGWDMIEDSGRGWRTVVPSPRPVGVLSSRAVKLLLDAGFTVIAGGGGGVPIARSNAGGRVATVEAVIDKDRTAALLGAAVGADLLIFLTAVPWVELNFGTPFSKRVDVLTPVEAKSHLAAGQFPAGSMGPKVEAACTFAEAGGQSLITSADALQDALRGRAGTRITLETTP